MLFVRKILKDFLDEIFVDADSTSTDLPGWLTGVANSFRENSEDFAKAWSSGRMTLFVAGGRHITDRECCEYIGMKDAEVDSVDVKYRREFLIGEMEDIELGILMNVSQIKIEALKCLCFAELKVMESKSGKEAARHRIEAFFWSTLFILNDNALNYGMTNKMWLQYIIAMCIAFMIIDDAIDMDDDKRAGSNTMFSSMSPQTAEQLGQKLLSSVCHLVFFHDDNFLPFVALNSLTMQTLREGEVSRLNESGIKNYALAAALSAALVEMNQRDSRDPKRVFDASVFMHALGKREYAMDFCEIC